MTAETMAQEVRRLAGPGAFNVFVPVRQSYLMQIADEIERLQAGLLAMGEAVLAAANDIRPMVEAYRGK